MEGKSPESSTTSKIGQNRRRQTVPSTPGGHSETWQGASKDKVRPIVPLRSGGKHDVKSRRDGHFGEKGGATAGEEKRNAMGSKRKKGRPPRKSQMAANDSKNGLGPLQWSRVGRAKKRV